MKLILVFGTLLAVTLTHVGVNGAWVTFPPFYGQRYTSVQAPRGLLLDDAGDILVVATRGSTIIALWDTPSGEGVVVNQATIVPGTPNLRLNHGIAFHNGYLYASSSTNVYRWPYTPGQRSLVTAAAETVVHSIQTGHHNTRTIIFDTASRLYVSVGSGSNVDNDSSRSRIRRMNLAGSVPAGGFNFQEAEIFADGLRNEVGLAFDGRGILWGVENGADELVRNDLGGDIHNGNPDEDLNKFDGPVGAHYGYPYCFGTHNLPGYEAGTQFAWPTFMNDGVHTDAWCRNTANNRPPTLAMAAHTAPLGIEFYDGRGCDSSPGAFPCSAIGDAFIAYHGSWNSDLLVGYRVGWLPFNQTTGDPTGINANVIYDRDLGTCAGSCFRPVNAIFDGRGHLIVSLDDSNEIFRVYYNGQPPTIIG